MTLMAIQRNRAARMTPAERENLLRFDGKQPGFYEVYFVEAQDPECASGLWVRYTLRSPTSGVDPGRSGPVAEVWAMFFDRRDPTRNTALKQTIPFSDANVERARLFFSVAGCQLTHSGCRGQIERDGKRIAWDLSWEERTTLVHYPFGAMYTGAFPKTKYLSPHFDLRARGFYEANGHRFALQGAPGQQSHIWGTKHAHRWIWAHANTFKEDRDAVFEGLTAQIKLGPISTPQLTLFALRYKGVEYVFNKPRDLLRVNESRLDSNHLPSSYYPVSRWIVGGGNEQIRFRGELWSDLSHYIGARYTDPDGSGLVCSHSKVANAHLEILVPDGGSWRVADKLTSEGAALEFVGREPDPRVSILVYRSLDSSGDCVGGGARSRSAFLTPRRFAPLRSALPLAVVGREPDPRVSILVELPGVEGHRATAAGRFHPRHELRARPFARVRLRI
jgi:hypothetical protein